MREAVRTAVAEAIETLLVRRQDDGLWRDYPGLPVGASDQWVTAVSGLALAEAAQVSDLADATRAIARAGAQRAADLLVGKRTYDVGWGYNGAVGADADSTAHVLLLMRALDLSPDGRDVAFLADHRQPDGGFSTYRSDDAWGLSHPCVSPVAAMALAACGADDAARTQAYALASRRDDGLWPAYWWDSALYATWQNLDLQRRLHFVLPPPSRGCTIGGLGLFDLIWLVGIRDAMGAPWDDAARDLLAARTPFGHWPGQRVLRVTEPDCPAPWDEPDADRRGRCYADDRGTLTTACALRVLARLLRPA